MCREEQELDMETIEKYAVKSDMAQMTQYLN